MRQLVFVGLLLGACRGGSSLVVVDALKDPDALAACAQGEVGANLQIIGDLRDSYHEMIVCGGLALSFDQAITNVIVNAALGRGGPSALVYQGNGTYATPNGMMMIRTSMTNGAGQIPFDVLDPKSYLAGLTVNANVNAAIDVGMRTRNPLGALAKAAGTIELRFSGGGPGAHMLGLAAHQLASGRLELDPKQIAKSIASHISVANRISVENEQGGTKVHYILEGDPQPLSEVLGSKTVPMKLASIVATHAATGQTIRITNWAMAFKGDGATVLDGSISLEVDGGGFPYAATFTYPHRKEPDIALSCR